MYEVQLNKTLTLSYLESGKKYLSMPDSNHDSKNCRGQMVSGTSAASIGIWMLKMANVAREIYCIGYWESNAPVLCLSSSKILSKLLGCKFNDVGNCVSLILSLTFIILWSLSINTRELGWQDRCV